MDELGSRTTMGASDLRASTLVWIDAREAVIVRMQGDQVHVEHMESGVPAHHRTTGHVRHVPTVRHGGGGPQSAGEPHRLEHLNRFIGDVANRLAEEDDLLVLGAGSVHERLARQLSASDADHGRHRVIACEASPILSDRQLIARLRRHAGVEPRRRPVGAYRWSRRSADSAPGCRAPSPRPLISKSPQGRRQEPREGRGARR